MSKFGRNRGAALVLALALAAMLVTIAVALFWISMYFGGEKEAKNAADSATLNLGKSAMSLSVELLPGTETNNFNNSSGRDVAAANADLEKELKANTGKVNLTNINRIWAKSMLIAMNADGMQQEGTLGSGGANAQTLYDATLEVNQRLSEALRDPKSLEPYYTDFSAVNPLHMLGKGNTALVPNTSAWTQAYLDRDYESNVFLDPGLYPVNFDPSLIQTKTVQTKFGRQLAEPFLLGYHAYSIMGMRFWQIPFRYEEHPHLVSQTEFNQSTSTRTFELDKWLDPIPNAFSTAATAPTSQNSGLLASACVQANMQETYPALIPQGYLKIVYHRNVINWVVNGVQQSSDTYLWPHENTNASTSNPGGYRTDVKQLQPLAIPCGTISATESVENEFLSGPETATTSVATLQSCLYTLPPNDISKSPINQQLQQRVNEMLGSFTNSSPAGTFLWQEIMNYATGPSKTWPDKDFTWVSVPTPPSPGEPDGTAVLLEVEPLQLSPNYGTVTLSCAGSPPAAYPTITLEQGQRWWTPGTGYSPSAGDWGCLGKVDVYRTTTVYVNGFCPGCGQ